MNPGKIQTKPDLPKTTHFAALVFKTRSIHHEGDERSRQCPGHGYPAQEIQQMIQTKFKEKS